MHGLLNRLNRGSRGTLPFLWNTISLQRHSSSGYKRLKSRSFAILRGRPLPACSSSFCSEQLSERNLVTALSAASLGRAVLDLPKCFTTSRTATHPRRACSSSSSFLRCLRGTQRARHAGVLGWPRYSAFVSKASMLRICCSQGRLSHPVRKALPITQTISTTLYDLPNWTPNYPATASRSCGSGRIERGYQRGSRDHGRGRSGGRWRRILFPGEGGARTQIGRRKGLRKSTDKPSQV